MSFKKYLVGSALLNLKNINDLDYISLENNNEKENNNLLKNNEKIDIFYVDSKRIASLTYDIDYFENSKTLFENFQYDNSIRSNLGHEKIPIEFRILENREKVIELLNFTKENMLQNYTPLISYPGGFMTKSTLNVVYTKFIIENNSIILTEEQKDVIQRIHDRSMPWTEYLEKFGL